MSEPKHKTYDHGKIELYHNAGSPASGRLLPTALEPIQAACMPTQGVGDNQRNGDQIYSTGVAVHMLLGQKKDRMNVTFRILVLKCTSDRKPVFLSALMEDTTANILLDSANTDIGTIVYQKFVKKNITPQLASVIAQEREFTHAHKFWLPMKKLVKFSQDSDTSFSGPKFYIYVFAYDAYGTLITDNIAYVQTWSKFYYRDP
jgi:hypothetical protein